MILNLAKTIYHRSKMQVNWEEDWFIQWYMGFHVCAAHGLQFSPDTIQGRDKWKFYTLLLAQTRKDNTVFKGKTKLRI